MRIALILAVFLISGCASTQSKFFDEVNYSSTRGDINKVKQFLAEGAQINAPGKKKYGSYSALYASVENCDFSMFKFLMDRGADPSKSQFSDGKWEKENVLHQAAREGWPECQKIAAYLINEAGVDVDVRDEKGITPSWWAVKYSANSLNGNKTTLMTRLLLDSGADPNAQFGKHGKTLLMEASTPSGLTYPNPETIKLLIQYGADPNARTSTKWARSYRDFLKDSIERAHEYEEEKRVAEEERRANKRYWKNFSNSLGNLLGTVAQSMGDAAASSNSSYSSSQSFEQGIQNTYNQTMDNINRNQQNYQNPRQQTNSVNGQNYSEKKEQCPLKPLGKFNPQQQGVGDDKWREGVKARHKEWRDSLSPYCKSLTPKADDLFKSGSGSGISK